MSNYWQDEAISCSFFRLLHMTEPSKRWPLVSPLSKDDVVIWFRNICGASRIDVLCALLDSCLPFEIRFIGAVIEMLGRKDYPVFKEFAERANKFILNKEQPEMKRLSLFNLLRQDSSLNSSALSSNPTSSNVPIYIKPPSTYATQVGTQQHLLHSNVSVGNSSTQTITSHPPPPLHHTLSNLTSDKLIRPHVPDELKSPDSLGSPIYTNAPSGPLLNGTSSPALPPLRTSSDSGSLLGGGEEDSGLSGVELETKIWNGGDLYVIKQDKMRQRMVLCMALLESYNTEAAKIYYSFMSQVDETVGVHGWLEKLREEDLDEVLLLYTLGVNHPAFSFEQRIMLSEICTKVRRVTLENAYANHPAFPSLYQPFPIYDEKYSGQYISQFHPQLISPSVPPPVVVPSPLPVIQQQQQVSSVQQLPSPSDPNSSSSSRQYVAPYAHYQNHNYVYSIPPSQQQQQTKVVGQLAQNILHQQQGNIVHQQQGNLAHQQQQVQIQSQQNVAQQHQQQQNLAQHQQQQQSLAQHQQVQIQTQQNLAQHQQQIQNQQNLALAHSHVVQQQANYGGGKNLGTSTIINSVPTGSNVNAKYLSSYGKQMVGTPLPLPIIPHEPPKVEMLAGQNPPLFDLDFKSFEVKAKNLSCFNCGKQNHTGQDCKEIKIDQAINNSQYRLHFTDKKNEDSACT